uniref:Reverse transcriptase domain-containing protein n=1 Tax=Tanacetum cinerariifolium TaxID=118510 RepID=A0A6L2MB86_TANCI|nr:reverse transcriptase domain-containing protein [Tanacetum cinerariifolium]GEV66362.1 reverse transcriptase domain-containing protein [Tanacetum cinerariifolium]
MSWNDFKFMMIEEFCPSHEMQKLETELWNHAMVGAGYVAYTNRFHKLARMVAAMEPKTMQKAMRIFGALIDEAIRNGSIKKEERMQVLGPSVPPATPTMHPEGLVAHASIVIARHECASIDHVKSACPRVNKAQGPGGNPLNQVVANNGGQGHGNQGNPAKGRAFMFGAEEAHQDLNIIIDLVAKDLLESTPIPVSVWLLDRRGTPIPIFCVVIGSDSFGLRWIWSPVWVIGIVRVDGFDCDLGHHSRLFEVDGLRNT